jgi:hypothetical protein
MIRPALAAALLLATPLPLFAQESLPTDEIAARSQAARHAEEVARQMAESQHAVAVAQRQFVGMSGGEISAGYRGAVAYPSTTLGVWQVAIIGQVGPGRDAPMVALAAYEIAQDEILGETIYPGGDAPYLAEDALAMARALREAPRAVLALPNTGLCIDDEDAAAGGLPRVSFATIVLPPRADGTFDAYVLNGPIQPGAFPLGKHFRVPFDQFGQVGEPVLLTDTCEVVTWDEADPDLASRAYVTEFADSDAPNEIHAFVSSQVPIRMGIVAGGQLWAMREGMIAPPVPFTPASD